LDFGFFEREENHPVSRSGCHPSFGRRGARVILDFGFWIVEREENHPVSRSGCHPPSEGGEFFWLLQPKRLPPLLRDLGLGIADLLGRQI